MASPNAPVQMQAADWLELQGLLARIEPGWQVLAFGSRARFRAKPHSDLDLAIVAPQALSLAWPFSATTSTRCPGGGLVRGLRKRLQQHLWMLASNPDQGLCSP